MPVAAYRPNQREAIEAALRAFRDGAEVVLVEGPTGIGKSLINVEVAEALGRAYYVSPQVSLVDQIHDDSLLSGRVWDLYGKSNYDCVLEDVPPRTAVDVAPCEIGRACAECKGKGQIGSGRSPLPCPTCRGTGTISFECPLSQVIEDEGGKSCPYYAHKYRAARGPIAVMTLAYFLLASTDETEPLDKWSLVKGRFSPRGLLVVDEAHGTADGAASFVSLTLSARRASSDYWKRVWTSVSPRATKLRDEVGVIDLLDGILPNLRDGIRDLREVLRDIKGREARKAAAELRSLQSLAQSMEYALEDLHSGNPWAIDPRPTEDRVILQPVLVGPFLRRRLWNRADRYLLTTATVLDPDLFLRELGLDGRRVTSIRMPSTFRPERAPIVDASVGFMSMRTRTSLQPLALNRLCAILDREPGRGIVHSHSYENAEYIRTNVPERFRTRLVFHTKEERRDVLEGWLSDGRSDSVLVSVGMTEGLDLKGDLARFAILWKVPYPDLGDRRVHRRRGMADGQHWYDITTLRSVIQACGRIVRSEDDEGRVYVLDGSFRRLLERTRPWIPEWFAARIVGWSS